MTPIERWMLSWKDSRERERDIGAIRSESHKTIRWYELLRNVASIQLMICSKKKNTTNDMFIVRTTLNIITDSCF